MAWAQHGMCELAFNQQQSAISLTTQMPDVTTVEIPNLQMNYINTNFKIVLCL
jgi:hypothetical protein